MRAWKQLVPRIGTDGATTVATTYTRRPVHNTLRHRGLEVIAEDAIQRTVAIAGDSLLRFAHGIVIALPVTRGCNMRPVCGKTFVELRYLRQHMEKHGEERFVCDKCGQRSRWPSNMERHRRKCKCEPPSILQ